MKEEFDVAETNGTSPAIDRFEESDLPRAMAQQKPDEAVWEKRIISWATGLVNSPFMFRLTREKRKDIKRQRTTSI